MASAAKRLRFSVARSAYCTPPRARPAQLARREWQRPFSAGFVRCEAKGQREGAPEEGKSTAKEASEEKEVHAAAPEASKEGEGAAASAAAAAESSLGSEADSSSIDNKTPPDTRAEESAEGVSEEDVADVARAAEAHGGREQGETMMDQLDHETRAAVEQSIGSTETDSGFWNYAASGDKDAEFLKDNVTSLGHEELERQREYREYARLAAWELPLLSKHAKPFAPPTKAQPLRFRYTSFLGEPHPAATKVVLEFCVSDLPELTAVQRDKLIKLLGVRYNPSADTAKMSCDAFPSQAQNKKFLRDRVADLLKAARDGRDTFDDVPFDFRHHKPKVFHEFPKEWILTEERKRELAARDTQRLEKKWAAMQQLEAIREQEQKQEETVMAAAARQRIGGRS